MPSLSNHRGREALLAGPPPTEALVVDDAARPDEVVELLARLRGCPVRFSTGFWGVFARPPVEPPELTRTLGEVLDGAFVPERAVAIDAPLPDDPSFGPPWLPAGSALTLWAAPAGATFQTQVLDAEADVLLVGLAGATACVVIPSARMPRLDVFPDRPDVSAIVVDAMTPSEREELFEYAEGASARLAAGQGVWVPAGSFVFFDWRERGAFLCVRCPRLRPADPGPELAPHTLRAARARPPDERWADADRVRLTDGVPLYAVDAEAGVRIALVREDVAVIQESFDPSSLGFRILGVLAAREDAPVTVGELRALAAGPELLRELSHLRRDGWITRLAPAPEAVRSKLG